MTTINYPPTLQGVSFAALSVTDISSFRTNDSEIGPATFELLSEDVPTIFNVQWLFYAFDFQVFENWYKYDLVRGVKSFNIDLPVAAGILEHVCNFTNSYSATRNGKLITVTAQLWAKEKQFNTESEYDCLLALASLTEIKNKQLMYDLIVDFANVTLPDDWEVINYGTDFS